MAESFKVSVIIPAIDPVTAKPVTPGTYAGLPDGVDVNMVDVLDNDRSSIAKRARYYLSAVPRQLRLGLRTPKPDLVLSMGLPITTLGIAWLTSALRGARFIADVRDLPFETAEEVGYLKNSKVLAILRRTETFFLQRADAVLTNSPRYKPALAARGVDIERITVAPIGYDNFDEPSAEAVVHWRDRLETELSPDTCMIGVYSGTLGYAFPVEEVLKGAQALANDRRFGFVFLGDGQRLDEFREYAVTHNLNATFPGRVNKQDVMAVCRAADYGIYPASLGKFSSAILGNKVFDYLGAKRPVLYVGEDSAVRDLINELGAGLTVGWVAQTTLPQPYVACGMNETF